MNKRGISDIITTVLIILIVLAAIVIVWNVVKKFATESSGKIGVEQFSVGLSTQTVDLTAEPILIPVSRSAGQGNITSIKIIFKDAAGNSKEVVKTDCIPDELETKICSIPRGEGAGKLIATFVPFSFEVYPVLLINDKEVIGLKAGVSAGGGGSSEGPGDTETCADLTIQGQSTCEESGECSWNEGNCEGSYDCADLNNNESSCINAYNSGGICYWYAYCSITDYDCGVWGGNEPACNAHLSYCTWDGYSECLGIGDNSCYNMEESDCKDMSLAGCSWDTECVNSGSCEDFNSSQCSVMSTAGCGHFVEASCNDNS